MEFLTALIGIIIVKKDLIIGLGVGIPVVLLMVAIGGGHSSVDFEEPKITTEQTIMESTDDCSGNARCFYGKVTSVTDGDTIKVDSKSIRFALASAPELDELNGAEAGEFIREICPVGSVALVDEDDLQIEGSYGRILAVIHCNGVNLNAELLDSGLGYLSSGFCDTSEFAASDWAVKHGC